MMIVMEIPKRSELASDLELSPSQNHCKKNDNNFCYYY